MYVQQIYTACLSEAAYYIESNGEAAIIDPLRDIQGYIDLAKERKTIIKYIFETHFHADFVSGHIDLSKATGAPIVYGPGADTRYPIHKAADEEVFIIGNCTLTLIHTPGHTLESSCYLLKDENQKPYSLFTGDTLFVGDVGRPDLSSGSMSSEELAGIMYETLQQKIMPLADDIIVYPAHGPGSSCGKNLGPNTHSTLAEEKANNYALQNQTKEDFVKSVTEGLQPAPRYFAVNANINQQGYEGIGDIIKEGTKKIEVSDFKKLLNEEVIVLDTRHATEFTEGFIPGSVFIGLEGRFAEWAGNLLPFDKPIYLITEKGKEEETVVRLARVGFSKMGGYLKGGFDAWKKAGEKIDLIINVEADEMAMDIPHDPNLVVMDVRNETEYGSGHVKDAVNLPLSQLTDLAMLAGFEENQNLYIHCAGGYRSVIAASLFKKQGTHNLRNVLGGWAKIKEEATIKIEKDAEVLN